MDYVTQKEFDLNTKNLENEDKRLSKRIEIVEEKEASCGKQV